ncbi:hypothetical protein SteCoe_29478 [Stentor coeruleus]|uniref:Uncharacterized protein n=1 Tax=Stentor coeruleus TaxID=5963 RepID=A0A1R2B5T3_9CILI|nr:hypothetical protein SteCoe_29478 [Stentor coeruleus]
MRGRNSTDKSMIPKLRHYSSILSISGSSNATESSFHKKDDSLNISNKPPRVPVLRTGPNKNKERIECSIIENHEEEKFHLTEYQKQEILKSRHIYNSQLPFWYMNIKDEVGYRKYKESNKNIGICLEDIELANIKRNDYTKWVDIMHDKL